MDAPGQSDPDQTIDELDRDDTPLDDDFDADGDIEYPDSSDTLDLARELDLVLEEVHPEPGTNKEDLVAKSFEVLEEFDAQLRPDLEDMVDARDLEFDVPMYVNVLWVVGGVLALVGLGALIGIGILFLAKLLGQLEDWSYIPWLVVGIVGYGAAIVIAFAADRWETLASAGQQVAFERAERRLQQRLMSLVVREAKNRFRRAEWSDPASDDVVIRTSSGLSAQINRSGRVLTESYERVRSHLNRKRGSAVRLSGPRGAGKTELLEEFCVIPDDASTESGGPSAFCCRHRRPLPPLRRSA